MFGFQVRRRGVEVFLSVLIVTVVISGCGGGSAIPDEFPAAKRLYTSGGRSGVPCNSCHTLDGSELVGPSFEGIATRAGSRVPDMSAEEYLRESITDPLAHIVDGYDDSMPTVYADSASPEEIDEMVAFLLTLERPSD